MNDTILAEAPPKEKRVKPIYRNLKEPLAKYENECLEYGYVNGRELCIFIAKESNKEVSRAISDKNLRCPVANIIKQLNKNQEYIQIHNHFNNLYPSGADIAVLINNSNISSMRIVTEHKTYIIDRKNTTKSSTIKDSQIFGKLVIDLMIRYAKKYRVRSLEEIYKIRDDKLSKRYNIIIRKNNETK